MGMLRYTLFHFVVILYNSYIDVQLICKSGLLQAHPKDTELLNNPIENYQQMEVIFGNGFATGKYAMSSSEALGSPSDFAESEAKLDTEGVKYDDVGKGDGQDHTKKDGPGGDKKKGRGHPASVSTS